MARLQPFNMLRLVASVRRGPGPERRLKGIRHEGWNNSRDGRPTSGGAPLLAALGAPQSLGVQLPTLKPCDEMVAIIGTMGGSIARDPPARRRMRRPKARCGGHRKRSPG